MNKQDRHEFLAVVSNDAIAERIIGMSFGEKREAFDIFQSYRDSMRHHGYGSHRIKPFREWLFDRVDQNILAERDASYHEAGEPL